MEPRTGDQNWSIELRNLSGNLELETGVGIQNSRLELKSRIGEDHWNLKVVTEMADVN